MKKLAQFAIDNRVLVDIFGLLLAVLVVHSIYTFVIGPAADQLLMEASEEGLPPPRTFSIILKDFEQEICLILGVWCLWLWLFRYQIMMDEPHLLKSDFLDLRNMTKFDAESLLRLKDRLSKTIATRPQVQLLGSVEASLESLQPGGPKSQFKEASDVGTDSCELYLEQLESDLSITKYILWAIPSVGFLGTVRGIGEALGQAGDAMAGDISGVAGSLGTAFNSTWCALAISLLLMLVSYMCQGREERLVANYKRFISTDLIGKLSTLDRQEGASSSSSNRE